MRLPIVVSSAILLCGAAPAGALVIDDFTTGPFNFQASIGGAVASQVCTCLGGAREISLQSGNASLDAAVQLLKPPGEAANVMPDGGGHLAFTYAGFAPPVDLTQGIAGGVLDVWFNAFAPGAAVRVTIEDDTGASQTQSQLPVLPILPANVGFALASFGSVDLVHVTRIEVVIDAPDVGDYHVREIGLPSPDLVQSGFEIGVASLAGGPYPSEPITFDACAPALGGACSPTLHVELSLSEVTGGMGSLPAQVDATLLPTTEGARISFGSEVMGVQPEPFHVVYRLAYPANGTTPVDGDPVLDWSPGQDHFQVSVPVQVAGGVQMLTLFGEPGAGQSIGFAGVSAMKGASTLITVDVDGSGNDPSLQLTLGGSFAAAPNVPALSAPGLGLLLVGLMIAAATAVGLRMRAGSGHPRPSAR